MPAVHNNNNQKSTCNTEKTAAAAIAAAVAAAGGRTAMAAFNYDNQYSNTHLYIHTPMKLYCAIWHTLGAAHCSSFAN